MTKPMGYYLRIGTDTLDEAKRYRNVKEATDAFRKVSSELHQYGQSITASLHIAASREEIVEDADYLFETGRNGGARRIKA